MRIWLRAHAHSVTAFVAMLIIATLMAGTMGTEYAALTLSALPADPLPMPPPDQDADLDSYADDVDLTAGDALVQITLQSLDAGDDIWPYFLVGTQDDQWRFGAGHELEWLHIVDPDALGWEPGSLKWQREALRTGAWWESAPADDETGIIARTGDLPIGFESEAWPQTFFLNVRDDQRVVEVDIQLYDAKPRGDERIAEWHLKIDMVAGTWTPDEDGWAMGERIVESGTATLGLQVRPTVEQNRSVIESVVARWTPELLFDSEERFFPAPGEALAQVHGFSRTTVDSRDIRTWSPDFNNGRDEYILLLADFTGDRRIDHEDAALMSDILRQGQHGDRVYAHAFTTTQGQFVVQYWFIYLYNFVEDEAGGGIYNLAHKGDREFISYTFDSPEDALNGTPAHVSFSQHYRGVRIDDPIIGVAPFDGDGTHMRVYVARGAHASFPYPGDDERLRPALAGYSDRFDGLGEVWHAGNYTVDVLSNQEWAYGHLWGPPTRYSRDFGTSSKPLLVHDFSYPFIDPTGWEPRLRIVAQDDLPALYGRAP